KITRFNQTIDIGGLRQYLRCIRFKPYSAVNLMTRAAQSESLEQRTQRILQSLFCQSKAYVLRFASSSAVESMFNRSAVSFICVLLIFLMPCVENFAAQSNWKEEWDKTLRDAEAEGQLTLYGCCYEYDRIVDEFKKKHPKIKVTTVLGAGGQLGARVLAERRGDKYLADVFSGGANTIHDVLYKAQALEPIKAKLILPEVIDASKWYEGEHRYIDPEQRYIFAFVANSQTGQVQYNRAQANAARRRGGRPVVSLPIPLSNSIVPQRSPHMVSRKSKAHR